jgi:basic membrane protein A
MADAVRHVAANRCRIDVDITDGEFIIEAAAQTLRQYAADGVDLVIAHGSQYGGSLMDIAPDFPDDAFAWGTARDTFGLRNLYAYEAASDQGAYVMGVVAGLISDARTVGVVGPIEMGDSKLYVDGFRLGAESEGADARIAYTGSFSDVALGSEAAMAMAAQGVDAMSATAPMP